MTKTLWKTLWTMPALALGLALSLVGAAPLPAAAEDAGEAANKALVYRYVEECLNGRDAACFEELRTPEVAAKARKLQEFRRSFFPDLRYEVREVLADGDRLAVLVTTRGRHTGTHPKLDEGKEPIPPSYGELEVDEVFLFTVSGDKLGDGRIVSDNLAVSKAVGYTVQPPPRP